MDTGVNGMVGGSVEQLACSLSCDSGWAERLYTAQPLVVTGGSHWCGPAPWVLPPPRRRPCPCRNWKGNWRRDFLVRAASLCDAYECAGPSLSHTQPFSFPTLTRRVRARPPSRSPPSSPHWQHWHVV